MEQSEKIFKDIKPEKYSFNDDKYYACFYAVLAVIHGHEQQKANLDKLIRQTGYNRFHDVLTRYTTKA